LSGYRGSGYADGSTQVPAAIQRMYRTDGRVSWPVKLSYAAGQAGQSVTDLGFGTLLFIYYNQALGLSGTYTGLGVAIALMFDALADPAVGSWSDGFQSKWGRRHLFMAASIVPLGLMFVALFWPPEGLTQPQLFLWFTVFSVLVRVALTFFNVPYLSLGAELSQDYQERTQIVAVRTVVGAASILGITAITWNFFFVGSPSDPTPQLTRAPYLPYALASALLMIVVLAASTRLTARSIPHLAGSRQRPRAFGVRRVYEDLYAALRNDSFRALFIGTLIYFVYAGTQGALWMHLMTFFWQLDTKSIQWIQYAGIGGAIMGVPLAPSFNRWFDKKWTVIVGVVVGASCDKTPIMAQLAGAMPDDPAVLADVLIALSFVGSFVGVQASITVASMMGDVADEHELKHGTRQEGVYFGSYSFSQKCTGALGNVIAGFAIDLIGLDPLSKPGKVPAAVLNHFGASYGLIALLIVASIWVFLPYSLNSKRHAHVLAELAMRRGVGDSIGGETSDSGDSNTTEPGSDRPDGSRSDASESEGLAAPLPGG
jgi:Na+/melibiose symporter-like transporter